MAVNSFSEVGTRIFVIPGAVVVSAVVLVSAASSACRVSSAGPVRPSDAETDVEELPRGSEIAETCRNALDDDGNGLLDEGCALPQGTPQFALAWDEPGVDVDLWVLDARGEVARLGSATATGLTKTHECPGSACLAGNVENVVLPSWEDEARGTYVARIRLEALGEASLPLFVRYGVKTFEGTKSYRVRLDSVGDEVRIGTRVTAPDGARSIASSPDP